MKKSIRIILTLPIMVMFCFPMMVMAVSISTVPEAREEQIEKGIKVVGDVVCLFQSGTEDVKTEIHTDDVLIVYRENRNHRLTEVGKIRILAYVGTDYLKGLVVAGELQAGDIAKKGQVASLVISTSEKCK